MAVPEKMQMKLGIYYARRTHSNHSLWAKQDLWDIKPEVSWHFCSPKTSRLLRKLTRILFGFQLFVTDPDVLLGCKQARNTQEIVLLSNASCCSVPGRLGDGSGQPT